MKIDSVATLGLFGVQKGMQGAREQAAEIANAGQLSSSDPTSVAEPLVALKQAEMQVAVSAEVIKAADEMIGTLIDELA